MATLRVDELNSQEFDAEAYIREYFKPMPISDEEREDRVETSKDIRDALLFLFALITAYSEYGNVDWDNIEFQYRNELERLINTHGRNTQFMQAYIYDKAAEFIGATKDNYYPDETYWTSDERATFEAVNEANDIVGYKELQKAIENGYTLKRWLTQNDAKVRKSHIKMEGKTIPIKDFFVLDKGRMLYPHDFVNCPDETYNCRCAAKYLKG